MNFPVLSLPAIVVVDDDNDDIFLVRHRLREGGIANPIVTFNSTREALAYLRFLPSAELKPSLIFTDIRMPNQSGIELISRVRDEPEWHDIKIAVMTSSNHPADLSRALELGVAGYLLKFPPSDLLAEFVRNGPWFASSGRTRAVAHSLAG